jgi:membrane-bound lytic murein transglycosylase D
LKKSILFSPLYVVVVILIGYVIYKEVAYLNASPYDAVSNATTGMEDYLIVPTEVKTFNVPEKFAFAGEQVPLHDPEVWERFDRELHVNIYFHSSTVFSIKRAARWLPHIEPILKKHNVPDDFKYLAIIESGLMNVKSPRGAVGFWQIMEETGKELGLEVNEEVDERYDPIKSTEAACKFLLKANDRFQNWTNTAASYNMGMTGLRKVINEQKADSYYDLLLNEETSRYLFRILALKMIMESPEKYGYGIPDHHKYKMEPLKEIKVSSNIPDLVEFAHSHGISYKTLKQYNPWLRKKTLTIKKPGRVYTITLPAQGSSFKKSLSPLRFDSLGVSN